MNTTPANLPEARSAILAAIATCNDLYTQVAMAAARLAEFNGDFDEASEALRSQAFALLGLAESGPLHEALVRVDRAQAIAEENHLV